MRTCHPNRPGLARTSRSSHDVIYEPRIQLFNIVPTTDAFYLATSSAGDEVTFSLGGPDEIVMTAVSRDTFGAIWARYGNDLTVQAADQISGYPGGPLAGGTANGNQLVIDSDGSRIMAGTFFGSVDFGGTVWSTNFANIGGALHTSSGGYVARTTDNTIQAMFRTRTSGAMDNTGITGLALHADGDLTIAGHMSDHVIFADDTTVSGGRGYIAHVAPTGVPLWSHALPNLTHLTEAGDQLLVRFQYREEFELGGVTYPAPSGTFGAALAAFDSDGNVSWIHRIESASNTYIREPRIAADGRIVVPFNGEDAVALDVASPVDLSARGHLWVLEPDGSLVWSADAPADSEYAAIALDESGVIWAAASICDELGRTIQPAWADPITVDPCDPREEVTSTVLFGLDPADGSVGFAHALFRGLASADDLEALSDGSVIVGAHYFDPSTVLPGTSEAFEVDQLGTGPNDLNGLLLLFR